MADKNIKGIVIEIGADTSKLGDKLKEIAKDSKSVQSELKQVDKLLKLDPSNTELAAQKQTLLAEQVSNTKEKLEALEAAQESVNEQFAAGDISAEQYREFQRDIISTKQELSKYEDQLKSTTSTTKQIADAFKSTGKVLTDTGKTLTKVVTPAIAGIGAAAIASRSIIDGAFKEIRATTGETGESLKGLQDDFREVYKTVHYSASDVGAAIGELYQRTGETGEHLQTLARNALELAGLTGGDLSTQIRSTTRIFEAWKITAEDQVPVMDTLLKVTQQTGIGYDELSSRLDKFAVPLQQLGFGLEESAAMMGQFEKAGVNVDQAMTGINKAMITMAKDGVTDGKEALDQIIERVKAMPSDMEAASYAAEFFGTKAGGELAAAIRGGNLELDDLLKGIADSPETIMSAADATRSFSETMTILRHDVETALEPLGKKLNELFRDQLKPIIERVVDVITNLIDKFMALSPEMQNLILYVAAAVAAIGPLLVAIGNMSTGIGSMIGLVGGLSVPVLAAVAAITALAVAAVLIYTHWDQIKEWFSNLWNSIKDIFSNAINAITDFIKQWGPTFLAALAGPFGLIAKYIYDHWDEIKAKTLAAWESLKDAVGGAISKIWDTIVEVFTGILDFYISIWVSIFDVFRSAGETIFKFIEDNLAFIRDLIRGVWEDIKAWLLALWEDIKKGVIEGWNKIKESIDDTLKKVKEKFSDLVTSAKEWGLNLIKNFAAGILGGVGDAIRAAQSVASAVADYLRPGSPTKEGPGKDLPQWGSRFVETFAGGIEDGLGAVRDAVALVAGELEPTTTNNQSTTYSGGNNIYITVQDGEDLLRTLQRMGIRF